MDNSKENYLKLVDENRDLRRQVEFYVAQADSFRREMLKERLWRIGFQMDYLKDLSDRTKKELEELEVRNGYKAEGAVCNHS